MTRAGADIKRTGDFNRSGFPPAHIRTTPRWAVTAQRGFAADLRIDLLEGFFTAV